MLRLDYMLELLDILAVNSSMSYKLTVTLRLYILFTPTVAMLIWCCHEASPRKEYVLLQLVLLRYALYWECRLWLFTYFLTINILSKFQIKLSSGCTACVFVTKMHLWVKGRIPCEVMTSSKWHSGGTFIKVIEFISVIMHTKT